MVVVARLVVEVVVDGDKCQWWSLKMVVCGDADGGYHGLLLVLDGCRVVVTDGGGLWRTLMVVI